MQSHKGGLRRAFMENHLITTQSRGGGLDNAKKEENIIHWITFYRRNWHIYAERVLGIKLKRFQQIMLYIMGISDTFFSLCSRGLGKSFLVALGAICRFMLFPYSEIVITSSTVAQANRLAEKKMRDEIIKKLSPYLLYMYEHEYIVMTKSEEGVKLENKLNGSTIGVLVCTESSRGDRATMLIYEEARLLKKNIIDSTFEKMAHPRQAKFLLLEEYQGNRRWQEQCQRVYITSARYSWEWYYTTFKRTVVGYYMDKRVRNNVFAVDIYTGINNGLKTWADYRQGKKESETDFCMEDLNEIYFENANAFFSMQRMLEAQNIEQSYIPPNEVEFVTNTGAQFQPKESNEIRLIVADYAFAQTTGKSANDNTIIICLSAHWKQNHFERHLDYIEGWNASDSIGACDRVRYLFWCYNADYCVCDQRSGGETLFNRLTMPLERPELGVKWRSQGLGVATKYHVVPQTKLDDCRQRVVERNPVLAIIPFIGTVELNAQMWMSLHRQFEGNNLKLLIGMNAKQDTLLDSKEYYKLSSAELADKLAPYVQTDMLINEAVNLQTEFVQDKIKLSEPKTGTKDRIVTLGYGNYIVDLIENDWLQGLQEAEYDADDIQLVF